MSAKVPGVDYSCPQCKQIDRVVKISNLFSGETAKGSYTGSAIGMGVWSGMWAGRIALSGTQQTLLAQHLAPPSQPKPARTWGFWSIAFLLVTAVAIGLTLLTGLLYGISPPRDPAVGQGAGSLLVIVFLFLLVSIVLLAQRSPAKRRIAEVEHLRWEQAMKIWNDLYYCARNDLIFLPGAAGTSVPSSDMRTMLRQASARIGTP